MRGTRIAVYQFVVISHLKGVGWVGVGGRIAVCQCVVI